MRGEKMLTNDMSRLSEKEIWEKYPDQWLGLTEVKWNKDRNCDIDSAVVSYSNMTKSKVLRLMSDTRGTENPVQSYSTIRFDGVYAALAE